MKRYFSKTEISLWLSSVILIILSFFIFDRENTLTLFASLLGVTSLIFNAKGNPFGQFLMVMFSILYGIISYGFSYYGEMITYERMFDNIFSPILDRFHYSEDDRKYIMMYYLSGINAVVMELLKNDCDKPIKNISSIITICIFGK